MAVKDPAVGVANISVLALEQHVNGRIKRLGLIGNFIRDLQSVEDKYVQEYMKLVSISVPEKQKKKLQQVPELRRVCVSLEEFVVAQTDAKATLVRDISRSVMTPMDNFLDQQMRQTKRMLAEIRQGVEKEQELDAQYKRIREHLISGKSNVNASSTDRRNASLRSPCNQNVDEDEGKYVPSSIGDTTETKLLQTHRKKQEQQLLEVHSRRKGERDYIKERLEELHLAEQQQIAVVDDILERIITVYKRMIARSCDLVADLQLQLSSCKQQSSTSNDSQDGSTNERSHRQQNDDDEKSWLLFLEKYGTHVDMTSWMNFVFTQVFLVEENMIKRLQTMLKLHPITQVFSTGVSSDAAGPATANKEGSSVRVVSDFMHYHKLLTVNLMDPISRTLKFSKQKQEKIRQELLQSLEETTKLVHHTRKKLKENEGKALKLLGNSNDGTSPISTNETHYAGHATDAMKISLSNFGLRSAVASLSKVQSPTDKQRNSLASSEPEEYDRDAQHAAALKKSAVEKELEESRTYLLSLERNEAEQRHDIMQTLQNTSLLSVKTMELMVNDYLKHMSKAFVAMQECITKYDALRIAAATDGLDAEMSSLFSRSLMPSSASWRSFITFLNEDDTEDPLEGIKVDNNIDDECVPELDSFPSNQEETQSFGVKSASYRVLTSLAPAVSLKAIDSKSNVPSSNTAKVHDLLSAPFTKEDVTMTLHNLLLQVKCCMAPIVAVVFRSEESTLVALTASMTAMVLMVLYISCSLARMHQSWEEIAASQRSSQEDFSKVLKLLTANL
ncbi:hypothetical protein FI667_g8179, partial [Globisporangium splendens]